VRSSLAWREGGRDLTLRATDRDQEAGGEPGASFEEGCLPPLLPLARNNGARPLLLVAGDAGAGAGAMVAVTALAGLVG
jgi:hypothetical protein